ncbi:hypothetical protein AVEN_101531-1 [Araneus ventricosus]|uniref:Uncharacterized protein n=1 Tax=Araneus ventricosus TaxID=182803 RepID=A0A4Y2GTS4_ARAVE|nr:hypothetical protein AVEN_101531-1 [Araneus ventricosus]
MQLEFPSQPKPSGTPDGAARSGPAQHGSTRCLFWYPDWVGSSVGFRTLTTKPNPTSGTRIDPQVSTWRERNLLNRRVTKLLRCKRSYTMKPLQTI